MFGDHLIQLSLSLSLSSRVYRCAPPTLGGGEGGKSTLRKVTLLTRTCGHSLDSLPAWVPQSLLISLVAGIMPLTPHLNHALTNFRAQKVQSARYPRAPVIVTIFVTGLSQRNKIASTCGEARFILRMDATSIAQGLVQMKTSG